MSKKRTQESGIADSLGFIIVSLMQIIIVLCYRLIVLTYDIITFHTSGYKQKSGNSFLKSYFDKGSYGEFILYRKVCKIFGKGSVLTNLYLDNEKTDTTEIDVLAVSNKGIYVYEMKNYSGYIYGSEKDQYWTQVLNRRTKNKFYNPLRQNYAHTKAVERYLEIDIDKIIPIIVFSDRSKLSKINISDRSNVFQYNGAARFVRNNEKNKNLIILNEEKESYLIKLIQCSNMPEEVKIKHIDQVKQLQESNKNLRSA